MPPSLINLLQGRLVRQIVVIWNNLDEPTPAPFTSDHGVSVRYRKPERDSLNEKLRVDGDYRTQAVLLSDDDIYYRPADLEFAFQSWRQFGRHRVTGALARCADLDADGGGWTYAPCRGDAPYSMVLTNLAFVHISFLDFYFTDDVPWLGAVRDAVDSRFNGEDIAVNYVVSLLTGNAPLLVRGSEQYVNLDPAGGISRKPGHFEARSSCLNEYADAMRCMPLVEQEARVERGVRYNVWYKALWDRYTLF
ncbi:alpha-1,4-N-acetylglucosaminyltransferase EXTL3 [Geosmithia morbida]|uniref:Alpha-1,4-N-acetylglucosaminyltransferase EXTL3 n=1 Tax=Geosmithia morbida TaxID=1094350 RepID=A0A9P4YXJ0_9HYPO|nr:alpha-1,4-N-acetylglucosaminyltransferase EXTL3 [Geosmithia morbida]KAF4124680.1 alpha-1,4-N-acetylglucosaminyltransferase EXTL3 [Geosmithia morbida]